MLASRAFCGWIARVGLDSEVVQDCHLLVETATGCVDSSVHAAAGDGLPYPVDENSSDAHLLSSEDVPDNTILGPASPASGAPVMYSHFLRR